MNWVGDAAARCFVSDYQGARPPHAAPSSRSTREGHFLALRVDTVANIGAYVSTFGAAIPSAIYSALLAGVYRTPAISVQSTGVFTNTVPTDAYRGAGRPEACYVLERLADEAARDARHRPRRNPPAQSRARRAPCRTRRRSGRPTTAATSRRCLRALLEIADYDGFAKRRAAAATRGKLRGFGMACYVESSGVAPSRFAARARRARRLLRGGADPRAAGRQRAGAARHPQSRPGPRHDLRADHRLAARRADGEDRDHRGRHRPGAVRHRHLRLALDRGRRLGARPRRDEDRRQGQADRRASARGRRPATSLSPTARSRSPAPTGASRSREVARVAPTSRPTIRPRPGARACRTARSTTRRASPGATARTPARSRSIRDTGEIDIVGYWARRRRRHRDQSDDRRGPDPGRHRARARPGAARALRL